MMEEVYSLNQESIKKALKEVDDSSLENNDIIKESLMKQLEKTVEVVDNGEGICSRCGQKLETTFMNSNYCHWCGQALKEE